jgi:hypothetical protein
MIHQNFISEWNRQFSLKIHKEKLKTIKNREPKTINTSLETYSSIRKSEAERSQKINRENKLLFNRLLFISERKSSPLLTSSTPPSKTLTNRYKKQESERIILENQSLLNRISINNSPLSVKKLMKDYKMSEEYRERISKKSLQDRIKKAVNSTIKPSITRPKGEESKTEDST